MPVRWIFLGLYCVLIMSCDNDDYPYADVPSVALNKFRSHYPDAKDVSWKQTGEHYEMEFEVQDLEMTLLISTSGEFLKHKKEIDLRDLPPSVMQFLDQKYGRARIDNPEKVRSGEQTYYQVEIERFIRDRKLVVDEDGKLMEKISYWD